MTPRWLVMTLVSLVVAAAIPATAKPNNDQEVLEEASARWKGSICRTRYTIELKKKKGTWVRCRWLLFESGLAAANRAQIMVSDAAAVHRAFPGGVIPAGTQFEAAGLVEVKNDVALELISPAGDFRVRVFYLMWKKSNSGHRRLGLKRLDQYEAWVRYEFLDVVANPSEELVEAPVTTAVRSPSAVPTARPTGHTVPQDAAGPPSIEIASVAVQPARVVAGAATDLIVTYSVGGVPPGAGFEVLERREIVRSGDALASFEERLHRGNGTHPSYQSLTVPVGTAPGIYSLRVTLVMAGRETSGSALFEVVQP